MKYLSPAHKSNRKWPPLMWQWTCNDIFPFTFFHSATTSSLYNLFDQPCNCKQTPISLLPSVFNAENSCDQDLILNSDCQWNNPTYSLREMKKIYTLKLCLATDFMSYQLFYLPMFSLYSFLLVSFDQIILQVTILYIDLY